MLVQEIEEKLKTLTGKDVPEFSYKGETFIGKIVDIYDGDTCKILLYIDGKIVKFPCRLNGIDTPEIKPLLSKPNRDKEIKNAKRCRNRLVQLGTDCDIDTDDECGKEELKELLDRNTKLVTVKCDGFDKYFRLLVKIFDYEKDSNKDTNKELSYNSLLISENYAKEYFGGTKEVFEFND